MRAETEEQAREHLTVTELAQIERVTVAGETAVSEQDRQLLAQLGRRPEWAALRRVGEEQMQRRFEKLARGFATKDSAPDFAQLQWERGVFAGIKFLLDTPTVEAAKLERLLAKEKLKGMIASA